MSINTWQPHASMAWQAKTKASFASVETWVFDLDNTLYSHEARIWPQVDQRITLFLADLFGLDGLSAQALQKYFYHRHGTTLKGLMLDHGVKPADFLEFVHRIDLSGLAPNANLAAALAALPGRRLILTNGTRQHAENVAGKLGILQHFDDVFGIVEAGFTPKPERPTYDLFLDRHGIDPKRAAMFEDIDKNLIVPHALGMQTVLVLPGTPDPFRETWEQQPVHAPHVGHMTTDLTGFLKQLTEPDHPGDAADA